MKDILLPVLRHLITAIGAILVARGTLKKEDVDSIVPICEQIAGSVITLASMAWMLRTRILAAQNPPMPAASIVSPPPANSTTTSTGASP